MSHSIMYTFHVYTNVHILELMITTIPCHAVISLLFKLYAQNFSGIPAS